jgi:hypothetical protein
MAMEDRVLKNRNRAMEDTNMNADMLDTIEILEAADAAEDLRRTANLGDGVGLGFLDKRMVFIFHVKDVLRCSRASFRYRGRINAKKFQNPSSGTKNMDKSRYVKSGPRSRT